MNRPHLVLDLETVLDTSLPPPPKKKTGGTAFPPAPLHQIVVMGAALLDEACKLVRMWIVGERHGGNELAALTALVAFLNAQISQGIDVTIVGFNSRGFDLPVIVARCLRHGLAFPWYYARRDVRYRYSPEGHFDLMDFIVDYGASRPYSLDLAAKLIGMPGKLDCKGASVAQMVADGELEKVRAYCLQDVAQTTALYLRTELLRGVLSPAEYAAAVAALLVEIEREPRLAPLAPRIDRERLLLPALRQPITKADAPVARLVPALPAPLRAAS